MAGNTVELKIKAVGDFSDVANNAKALQNSLSKIKLPDSIGGKLRQNLDGLVQQIGQVQKKSEAGFKVKGDVTAFGKDLKQVDHLVDEVAKELKSIGREDLANSFNLNTQPIQEATAKVQKYRDLIKQAISTQTGQTGAFGSSQLAEIDKLVARAPKVRGFFESFKQGMQTGNFDQMRSSFDAMVNHVTSKGLALGKTDLFQNFKTQGEAAFNAIEGEVNGLIGPLNMAEKELQDVTNVRLDDLVSRISGFSNAWEVNAQGAHNLADAERNAANEALKMSTQLNNLKSQANYFFSLQNMFQLLKRGIRDAVDTIKELDASMTETAVVTDFSVSDMWNMLPQYTKAANELGSTINDVYQAATLYYQQGLDQNQAMGLATETLKMARIGGLEAAEATDMMTAALRGFNMELSEASGKHINDVYSNLAAKTASDTRELGEAMERTASIAHSANMSFEMTSAFLANMIETTREAPENLGTAMKTIVARFQEMKENPYEIGEVEGEEVNFNRVDKALKTIGVELTESRDKFRDLDDVFMDISEKWDGLSQTQQRYIATIAAGSRQQSRFIAMVGNYKRMTELAEYANDSEGASQVQFEKTLDSMQAKMNQFKNAWDQFVMGIANNKIVKFAVDFGTKFVGAINKMINAISGGNGIVKSVLSLVAAFSGLKLAGKFINSALGGLGKLIDPNSKGGFAAGLTGRRAEANATQAKMISNPIVNVLNRILANMPSKSSQKTSENLNMLSKQDFKKQYGSIRDILYNGRLEENGERATKEVTRFGKTKQLNSYRMSDIAAQMEGMSTEQQAFTMKNNPSLKRNLSKGLFSMFAGTSNGDLTPQDKIKFKGWTSALQKYAQTPGTGLEMTDLMTLDQKSSQAKMTQALATIDPEVQKLYQQNIEKYAEKFANNKKFQGLSAGELQEKAAQSAAYDTAQKMNFNAEELLGDQVITKTDKFAQGLGKVGGGAQSAGMALQGMGTALSQMGLETLGGVVSGLGTAFMSLGSAISGVGEVLKVISLGAFVGIAAALIAITAAVVLWQKHQQKIKDDAKEVAENYKNATDEAAKNLTTLEDYREDYARLAQGVDSNGKNVNLGAEEYQDYLKMTNDIANMSPELVKGWNSEGNAIIQRNGAVEKAIQLEHEREQQAKKDYTTMTALEKTYKAMQQDDDYKLGQSQYINLGMGGGTTVDSEIKRQAQTAAKAIKDAGGGDILKAYGIDPDSVSNMSQEAMRILDEHGAAINDKVKKELTDLDEDELEEINDSIAEYGKKWDKYRDSYAELLQQFQVKAGEEGFYEDINESLTPALDNAIESVVSNGSIPIEEKWDEIQTFHDNLKDLTFDAPGLESFGSDYETILDEVQAAQDEFDSNLDTQAYEEATDDWLNSINNWADAAEQAYKDTGDRQYQILHEMLTNQATQIETYAEENAAVMEGAFNTLDDEIASAQSSYEAFQKSTEKGDYYTAAENVQKIITEVIGDGKETDIDNTGKGSHGYWKAADMVLGRDQLYKEDKNGEKELKSRQEVTAQLKEVKKSLEPGRSGANEMMLQLMGAAKNKGNAKVGEGTFSDYFAYDAKTQTVTTTDKLQNASAEELEQLAGVMGRSTDAFVAGLNNAKQFFDISFTNTEGLYNALKNSGSTLAGESGSMYTSETAFEAEAEAQGVDIQELEEIKSVLIKKGVKFLPPADELTSSDMAGYIKDWGVINKQGKTEQKDLINYLLKAGYGKEDIRTAIAEARKSDEVDITGSEQTFDEDFTAAEQEIENPTLSSIDTTGKRIADSVDGIAASLGVLSQDDVNNLEANIKTTQLGEKGWDTEVQQAQHGLVGGTYAAYASPDAYNTTMQNSKDRQAEYERQLALTNGWSADLKEDPLHKRYIELLEKAIEREEAAQEGLKSARNKDFSDMGGSQQVDFAKSWLAESKKTAKKGESEADITNRSFSEFTQKMRNSLKELSDGELEDVAKEFGKSGQDIKDSIQQMEAAAASQNRIIKKNGKNVNKAQKGESLQNYVLRMDVEHNGEGTKLLEKIDQMFPNGVKESKKKQIIEAVMEGDVDKVKELTKEVDPKNKTKQKLIRKVKTTKEEKTKKKIETELSGDGTVKDKLKTLSKANVKDKKFKITANDEQAIATINKLNGNSVKVNDQEFTVSVKKGRDSKYTVSLNKAAEGINNQIFSSIPPSIHSLAKGTKNKNFKGGPTLTGEEGYEIAWSPSENKSMILGTQGPQVVDLPPDVVVWDHKQSKQIMKQKPQAFGSMAGGGGNTIKLSVSMADILASQGIYGGTNGGGSGGSGKNKTATKKSSSSGGTQKKEIIKLKNYSVYIFNMTQKIEQVARKIEDRQRTINANLEKAYITRNAIRRTMGQEIAYIKQNIKLNTKLRNHYNKQLDRLDRGKLGKETIKWSNTQKTKKKGDKKWTTGSKSNKAEVNLGKYIKYDASTGAYVVDQAKINEVANSKKKGGYNKAKAIAEAAQKQIEKYTSGRDKAVDAIRDADDKLKELAKQVYDTFYSWENELTKVYDLSQRIEFYDSKKGKYDSLFELRDAILKSGLSDAAGKTSKALIHSNVAFQGQINSLVKSITAGSDLIAANIQRVKKETNDSSLYAEKNSAKAVKKQAKKDKKKALQEQKAANKILNNPKATKKQKKKARKRLKKAQKALEKANADILESNYRIDQANDNLKTRKKARRYMTTTKNSDGTVTLNINEDKLERDRLQGKITQAEYDAIKKMAEGIQQANQDLLEAYQNESSKLAELYTTLSDLKQQYADYASDLRGYLENARQQEIDKLEKLNSSLTNALKELLDEVKKRLDQRRQQEENRKTEEDIAKKQQRLAALRADSSGSNAKQIKQLEKEIADAQANYTKTLEDQTLQRLQDKADEASTQRETQIKLLTDQLEYDKQTGAIAKEINEWLQNPERYKEQIEQQWQAAKNWNQLADVEKNALKGEWDKMWADLNPTTGLKKQITLVENAIEKSNTYLAKLVALQIKAAGGSAQTIQQSMNNAGVTTAGNNRAMAGVRVGKVGSRKYKGKDGKTHTRVYKNGRISKTGTQVAASNKDKVLVRKWDPETGKATGDGVQYDINTIDAKKRADVIKNNRAEFREAFKSAVTTQPVGSKINSNMADLVKALGVVGKTYKLSNGIYGSVSGKGHILFNDGLTKVSVWKPEKKQALGKYTWPRTGKADSFKAKSKWKNTGREFSQVNEARIKKNKEIKDKNKKYTHFKKGGIANFTGPAWLDGTKSKPELVLNAQDTKNFLTLRDTLSKAVSGAGSVMNDTNMTYDIDINVDHISSDYDVDQIANRVQKKIVQSAGYRNVNAVRNLR